MFVHPAFESMSVRWVLAENKGAAISLGATGLTGVASDVAMGNEFSARMALPGKTIGTALTEAKQALSGNSGATDVILGWLLLGDPTLKLEP